MALGDRIRTRRQALNISLRELAAQTDLTHSFLSQVEREKAEPSISSLRKIANALDCSLAQFFAEGKECDTSCIIRSNQRPTLQLRDSGMEYELLNPDLIDRYQFFMATLAPGAASSETQVSHPLQECTLVLQGKLELELGNESFVLEEGDSAGWDGNLSHRLVSIGDDPLIVISVTSPSMFVIREIYS